MRVLTNKLRVLGRIALVCLLSACGGGSGGGRDVAVDASQAASAGLAHVLAAPSGSRANSPATSLTNAGASAPTGNGVYAYGPTTAFPYMSNRSTNYWVDVLFAPAPAQVTAYSLWPASAKPVVPTNDWGTASVNVGMRFKSDVSGYISAIRFYKGSNNTGTHVGALWTVNGQPLATATFTNETASGWQQVNFDTPVAIAANTEYVASYLAPQGGYAVDQLAFTGSGVDNAPLHALQDGVTTPGSPAGPTGNGVYAYGPTTAFPYMSNRACNYWVDVVFTTTPPPQRLASLWPQSATPVVPTNDWGQSSVNLGVRFKSDVDGSITGIRFYKGAFNTGTHVGALWTIGGQQLATATFTNETASGWQQVNFDTPVAISANTEYVASYLAPEGGYAVDQLYFTGSGVDSPPLHAFQDGASLAAPTITPLYDATTALEPATVVDTGTAIVTRFSDRARDRHARESQYQSYDHYLSWYWEQRTITVEITDKVAKGGTDVVFNIYTLKDLGRPEFRAFYRGVTTVAEYSTNLSMTRVGTGTNPYQYTTTLRTNSKEGRPIAPGDRMELEVSQFIQTPDHGRSNYYGTAVLYVVGQGGLVPWEGRGANLDSFPMAQTGWTAGTATLPYQYSNEPLERFKEMSGNMAPGSAQAFMLGRRLHHTDFATGVHSEFPNDNPVYTEQVGKLGPQFYAPSCVACHLNNGRAIPPGPGTKIVNAVTKIGTSTGAPDPDLGSSLQPFRTGGVGEGSISIASYSFINGTYGDGTPYQLRRPNYAFEGKTPTNFSVRNTPALVGMGLLEAVPESQIMALADPNDANGDGISGRVQTVVDPQTGQLRLGRFGWKAGKARISHQIASALNSDMGVTTSIFQQPDCGSAQSGCGAAGVKLNDADLANWVRYVSLLGVAARRNLTDAQALQGETLFASAGCSACHVATLTTSAQHPFAELRSQTIHPYTDLLLHDMGSGLADNLGEGNASGAEWRTTPLWSIGLAPGAAGGLEAYLHDGRARDLNEAILWHGGEAEAAKENFRNMSSSLRAALLKFLQSL